jgi:hypothetical protein
LWDEIRPNLAPLALAVGGTLLLAATFFLTLPQGLAAALESPGQWLSGLRPGAGEYAAWELLARLVMNEALLVALGLAGTVIAFRSRNATGQAAALVTATALLIALLGAGRHPADLAVVVLPLVFLAGPVAADIVASFAARSGDADIWLLYATNLILWLAAAMCLPGMFSPTNTANWRQVFLVVGLITLALAVVQWFAYGAWGGWRTVRDVLPAVLLTLGLIWTVSQTVGINFDRGAWRQAGVLHESTGASVADLERALGDVTALTGRGAREAVVNLVLTPGRDESLAPVLRWLLRDYPMVHRSAAVPIVPGPVVITAVEEQPVLATYHSGAEFPVLARWNPSMLPDSYARLRWVLFRESRVPPEMRNVLLWFRRPTPDRPALSLPVEPPTEPAVPKGPGAVE